MMAPELDYTLKNLDENLKKWELKSEEREEKEEDKEKEI